MLINSPSSAIVNLFGGTLLLVPVIIYTFEYLSPQRELGKFVYRLLEPWKQIKSSSLDTCTVGLSNRDTVLIFIIYLHIVQQRHCFNNYYLFTLHVIIYRKRPTIKIQTMVQPYKCNVGSRRQVGNARGLW